MVMSALFKIFKGALWSSISGQPGARLAEKEMPSLDNLQSQLGGDDFEVIALAVDRGDIGKITGFYRELGLSNLAIYHDKTAKAGRTLAAPGLPTTLVINRDGTEIGRVLGDAEWDGEEAIALLKAAIAQ